MGDKKGFKFLHFFLARLFIEILAEPYSDCKWFLEKSFATIKL